MSTSADLNPAEARFRSLIDHLGAIVWEAIPAPPSAGATFTYVSDGTQAMLGHAPERWLREPRFWLESVHPEDRERVRAEIGEVIAQGRGADLEYRCVHASGGDVWVRTIVRVQDDGEGGVRLHGVVVDVSEQRAADARLRRLQEVTDALAGLLDAREIAAVVATQGRRAVGAAAVAVFLRATDDELEISGYDASSGEAIEPFCRVPLDADVPAAEAARTGRPIVAEAKALDRRYPGSAGWRRLAGPGQFVALPLALENRILGSLALRMAPGAPLARADRLVLEVLTRACAQALLRAETVAAERAAVAVLDTIITTAPEGFALFDTDLRYVRVNEALAAINGVPAADHRGRTVNEIVPGVPEQGHLLPLRQVLATGRPVVDVEVAGFTAADPGREHTWIVSYYPVRGPGGTIDWLGAFVLDITARKRQEERARLLATIGAMLDEVAGAEERLRRLVDALVPGVADGCAASLHLGDGRLELVAAAGLDVGEAPGRLTLPLVVRGRALGALDLGVRPPRSLDGEDRALAEEVARRAALAVDNAQLYERERQARDWTQRQYAVAAALADALTPADVAAAVLREVVEALGAEQGTVWQVTDDGTALTLIGARGFAPDELADHQRIGLRERRPVPDAVRARTAACFRSAAAIDAAYPSFGGSFAARGLESALVVPLLAAGRAAGGLFVSAGRPGAFGTDEQALASALAAQAGQALERARLFEAERRVSVTLQRSLLPATLPEVDGAELAVRYLPAAGLQAGGDFYEALALEGGAVGIAVGDVVGRGATAAAAMGQLRSALRAFAMSGEGPAAVLERLSAFADTVGGAMAATAVVGRLEPATGELRYACAGHPWPLLIHADGTAEYLRAGRGVPMACTGAPSYAEATARLRPGSTLLLYTDGLTERRGHEVDDVLERLRAAAAGAAGRPLEELLDAAVAGTGDAAPADDVALVAVRLAAGPPPRTLRFAAARDEVPAARAQVRQWLADAGVPRGAADDVLLAAGEAVANAVEHSGTEEVVVELSLAEPGVAAVVVADRGRWRAPVVAPHRGRGLPLMGMLMDDVDVERRADGTVVRLRHRFAGTSGDGVGKGEDGCTMTLRDGVAVLSGELDLASAPGIRDEVLAARPDAVDLSAVGFLDSSGGRMLLEVAEALGRRLVVVAPAGGAPRRALELNGLTGLLDVRD